MKRTSRLALVVALAGGVVGCGGSSNSSSSAETSAPTTAARTTTTPPSTTVAETTTTVAPAPVYPLTGLPMVDPGAATRPAMVVKIDNHRSAAPQSGLIAADIVFEEIVEAQTRFAIILHSQVSDPVGPIRSGRTQDIDLLGSFNKPLFVWSGGNNRVTNAIEDSDLVDLSAQHGDVYRGGGFYRSNDREAPHNLYAQASMLWTLAPPDAGPPPQQFRYLAAGEVAAGDPAAGVDLDMDKLEITWRYDPATGLYFRTSEGAPHEDAAFGQVTTNNVIVMVVDYKPSPADPNSPEAQTIGSGEVLVFTGGVVIRGTWTRADRLSPIVLTGPDGQEIKLTPGRTWIELPIVNTFTVV